MKWANLRTEILEIYKFDNSVANDDKKLIAKVWNRHGWDMSENLYENLKKMPSAESIRRTRQKLVAEGLIKPNNKTTERRYKEFKDFRYNYDYV